MTHHSVNNDCLLTSLLLGIATRRERSKTAALNKTLNNFLIGWPMQDVFEGLLTSWSFAGDRPDRLALHAAAIAQVEGNARAAEAVWKAEACLKDGDGAVALTILLYAQRHAPSSSLITLLIGDLRLLLGRPEAAEPYDLLAKRSDWNAAWYRLALTRVRAGLHDLAALEIHETLSRNAPLLEHGATALVHDIARASGARGWCGLNNNGEVFIGGAAVAPGAGKLVVSADGAVLPLPRMQRDRKRGLLRLSFGVQALRPQNLQITMDGVPLIGSPIKPQSVTRLEGFVERMEEGIAGWCWLAGEPAFRPAILVRDSTGEVEDKSLTADEITTDARSLERLNWHRRFSLPYDTWPEGQVSVLGPLGRTVYGSPLMPGGAFRSGMSAAARLARRFPLAGAAEIDASDRAAEISIPARHRGRRAQRAEAKADRKTLIAIPVYRGFRSTIDCVRSVLTHRGPDEEVLVISDASPDPNLVAELKRIAQRKAIMLTLEETNRGFPGTANLAMREAAERGLDLILLNSDTLVAAGWVGNLRRAVYSAADIGTATPFSNSATILSYPSSNGVNAAPTQLDVDELAAAFANVNGDTTVEIPTGHGFCLYIRHECLVETGALREDIFAQGYGEENDFCMRARHLGWRHVAATGVYIGHIEGQSFNAAKESLVKRNLRVLNTLHPGYDALIAEWERDDPLRLYRRRVDVARFAELQGNRQAIGFVTHSREGGVLRHVQARAARAEDAGFLPIILKPAKDRSGAALCDVSTPSGSFPNLRFHVESELALLECFLRARMPQHTELHHFIGHEPETIALVTALGPPFDIHIHDYAWFCPRITLTSDGHRYCGEPELTVCAECVRDRGGALDRDIKPADLIAWSRSLFLAARAVIAPTADTAARYARRFQVMPRVQSWEEETKRLRVKPVPAPSNERVRRVCVAGAIGLEKGYQVLLDCARFAAAGELPVQFQIVGFTCDDARLLETGKVTISGRYEESEAVTLIRRQEADLAFLPALWPETWSYVLSQLWEAELPVIAFDIGAQAERIRRRHGGLLLPLSLPPSRIVHSLCNVSS
jgi:GT2 family glycosyltransferase